MGQLDVSHTRAAFSLGGVQGQPGAIDPKFVPHVIAEGAQGWHIDQAHDDTSRNSPRSGHGGQQHGMFGAVPLSRPGNFGSRSQRGGEIFFAD